jgi:hypothetical protein
VTGPDKGLYGVGDSVRVLPGSRAHLPDEVALEPGLVVLVTPRYLRVRFPSGRMWHLKPRDVERVQEN